MKKHSSVIGIILLVVAAFMPVTSSASEGIDIHGFISQGYLKSTDNNYLAKTEDGSFEFNELGLNFSTELTDDIRLGLQFFARDLGPEGNDEIKIDWAYGDYRFKDYLGIRMGKIKLVYGLYNDVRELDMTRTSILLPQSVYTETWRDSLSSIKGVSLYGDVPIPVIGSFLYNIQAGALNLSGDAGFAVAFEESLAGYSVNVSDMSADTSYTAGLEWQPSFVDGLRFKGTYYDVKNLLVEGTGVIPAGALPGPYPPTDTATAVQYRVNDLSGYVVSAEYLTGGLTLACEFFQGDFQGDLRFSDLAGPYGAWTPRPSVDSEGYYATGAYRFTDLFEWGLGYSEYYPNRDDKDGDNQTYDYLAWEKDIFTSFRFDLNDYTILKLEAHAMNGFGAYSAAQDPSVIPEEDWYLFASKITFSF